MRNYNCIFKFYKLNKILAILIYILITTMKQLIFFKAFVKALHHVLPSVVGHCYDEHAWSQCLNNLAKTILA